MAIMYGTLIQWFEQRNYGFIREDSGVDYFVHVSGFIEKIAPPQNTRLRFRVAPNPQKPGREMAVDAAVIARQVSAPVTGGGR